MIGLTAIEDAEGAPTTAEALVTLFRNIGIQVNYRKIQGTVRQEAVPKGDWEMHVDRMGQEFGTPNTRCDDIAPIALEAPSWHRGNATALQQLQPYEQEMVALANQFCAEADSAKQKELMSQYHKLHTENIYTLGVVIGRYGLGMAKTIKNVPIGTPAFLYQWDFNNFIPEQMWIPAADQSKVPETQPDTIPIFAGN